MKSIESITVKFSVLPLNSEEFPIANFNRDPILTSPSTDIAMETTGELCVLFHII